MKCGSGVLTTAAANACVPFIARRMPDKRVSFSGAMAADVIERLGRLVTKDGARTTIEVPEDRLREVIGHLLAGEGIGDLAIEDPPLEDVMRKLFKHKTAAEPESKSDAG